MLRFDIKNMWWILIGLLLVGCNTTKKATVGQVPDTKIGRSYQPATVDSVYMSNQEIIRKELSFIDWGTWKVVKEIGTDYRSRVQMKAHPFKVGYYGIASMHDGMEWEVHIKTPYGCLNGPLQVLRGNPIYMFHFRSSCMIFDNIEGFYFGQK